MLTTTRRSKVNTLYELRSYVILLLLAAFGFGKASAVDPATRLTQYAHSSWTVAGGTLVGSPNAIAQTTDGYIWIGTNLGLVRFDGVRFLQWNPPRGERLLDSRVVSLLGSKDGSLWIGTVYGLSRWKNGHFTNYPGLSSRIEALLEDDDGAIWMARTQVTDGKGPICRIKADRLKCFGNADKVPFPNVLQLARSDDGYIWLVGYSELCRWEPGAATVYFPNRAHRPEGIAMFNAIATDREGSTWAVINKRDPVLHLQHFVHGSWVSEPFPGVAAKSSQVTTLFVDRDNELWIGTSSNGLFRVQDGHIEHYDRTDGLSSNFVLKFYQDEEGTVWVVTSAGIDNFRDLHVLSYSMRDGLSSDGATSVVASQDGGLWVLNDYNAIQKLKDGRFSTLLPRPGLAGHVSTIFEDHAGRLWIGFEDGLDVYDNGVFHPILRTNGAALGIVFTITEDTHHDIWVRAGPNLDEIADDHLVKEISSPQIRTSYILAATPDGGVVLGLVNGDLLEFRNGQVRSIPSNETGNTSQVRDLLVDPDGTIWGTTVNELVAWKGSIRRNLSVRNGLPCDGIFALVEDESRAIWLYSRCGLIHVARAELDRWWQHPGDIVQTQLLDEGDGVHPGLTPLKPQAARTSDGRLWFANGRVVQMFDPEREQINQIPPPVKIEAMVADQEHYSPKQELLLPPLTRDLEIQYTAMSYVSPQKVFFRYKLDGHDARWQEPGNRRQAFYSDLGPGTYHFQVIACNNDGVWNKRGAVLDFTIAPSWYQTIWFRIFCILFGALIVWSIYRLRVHQIAVTMKQRFDERLAERMRLAREFHDTFLQTIQGGKMIADDALDSGSDEGRMRQTLEKLSVWLGQAVEEGRAALHSLRVSTTEKNQLSEALQRATEDHQLPSSMTAAFSVIGDARDLHPIVRDEVYRIGYEAIRNAATHSRASQLEIELRYANDLLIHIRDNGVGIDPAYTDRGRAGHFGLQGMRERASRIRGKLTIISSANTGTEVTLIVPGDVVFRNSRPSFVIRLKEAVRRLVGLSRGDEI